MSLDERTDEIDVGNPDRVRVGVSRGETDVEIGRPRDYPDRADVAVSPTDSGRVLLSLDAIAGDHGAGHADVELSVAEARELRDVLDETVRWMIDDESDPEVEPDTDDGSSVESGDVDGSG